MLEKDLNRRIKNKVLVYGVISKETDSEKTPDEVVDLICSQVMIE